MQRKDHRDGDPHVLVVEHVDEDGTFEWTLEHPGCTEHQGSEGPFAYSYYDCLVQAVIDGVGLRDAMEDEWVPVVGRLLIVGCSTYDEYTHESDIWIEPA